MSTITQPPVPPIACVSKHTSSIRIDAYTAVVASMLKGFATVKRAANTVKRIKSPNITLKRIPGCVATMYGSSHSGPINIARPKPSVIYVRPWSTTPPV